MIADLLRAVAMGALQGATEFLPVSSSGHLVVVPALLGWPAASLTFAVAVHWATALAVVWFLRADWAWLLLGAAGRGAHDDTAAARRQLALLVVGSVPAVLAGLAVKETLDHALSNDPYAMARFASVMLLVTGSLLVAAEWLSSRRPRAAGSDRPSTGGALLVGIAQALAIAPGVSRSGATMAGGLLVGLDREAATRFSFLLAAPIMLGAGMYELTSFALERPSGEEVALIAVGFVSAFIVGYVTIGWLLRYVKRSPLYPFAAYTLALGLIALWLLQGK